MISDVVVTVADDQGVVWSDEYPSLTRHVIRIIQGELSKGYAVVLTRGGKAC